MGPWLIQNSLLIKMLLQAMNYFLKVEQVGYYAGRVKYDSQIVGPQRFTLISLTGKEILYHLFITCISSIKIHNITRPRSQQHYVTTE